MIVIVCRRESIAKMARQEVESDLSRPEGQGRKRFGAEFVGIWRISEVSRRQ